METIALPHEIAALIGNSPMKDVSGWSGDKTYSIESGSMYLKIAAKGNLKENVRLLDWWSGTGLSAKVIRYVSDDADYLLTTPVAGHDGIWEGHLAHPERLCRAFGEALRRLHETDASHCPVNQLTTLLLRAKTAAFSQQHLDILKPFLGEAAAADCAAEIAANAHLLKSDVLTHGDYCLPNIMLDGWRLTGFIDIAASGVSDRHYDIAWGLWSILFNLKSPAYGEIFLDAYGRNDIDPERLRICALLSSME